MGASSRQFLMIQEDEHNQLHVPVMTKKEVQKKAEEDVKRIMAEGSTKIAEAMIDTTRLAEYLVNVAKHLKKHVGEKYDKYEVKGSKFSFRGTGDRLDYDQDEVYASIKESLKQREELLKLAFKSKDMLFDSEGVEVPKVGVKTPSKQTLVINW